WRLHLEGERLVLVVGDHHRDRRALLDVLRLRVERLAELHDVDAALTERGTDRRRRRRRGGRHLQFQIACDFLCHSLFSLESAGRTRPGMPWSGSGAWQAPSPPTAVTGQIFSTWPYSSSTGVARPKIDTATFNRARTSSTSSTLP